METTEVVVTNKLRPSKYELLNPHHEELTREQSAIYSIADVLNGPDSELKRTLENYSLTHYTFTPEECFNHDKYDSSPDVQYLRHLQEHDGYDIECRTHEWDLPNYEDEYDDYSEYEEETEEELAADRLRFEEWKLKHANDAPVEFGSALHPLSDVRFPDLENVKFDQLTSIIPDHEQMRLIRLNPGSFNDMLKHTSYLKDYTVKEIFEQWTRPLITEALLAEDQLTATLDEIQDVYNVEVASIGIEASSHSISSFDSHLPDQSLDEWTTVPGPKRRQHGTSTRRTKDQRVPDRVGTNFEPSSSQISDLPREGNQAPTKRKRLRRGDRWLSHARPPD